MKLPLLTVFTDASHCPIDLVGGWAVWAKRSDMGTFFYSAGLKGKLPNSTHAEFAAIANAVTILRNHKYLGGDHHVLIKTDAMSVIQAVGRFADNIPVDNALHPYAKVLMKEAESVRCLELRHVKAHRSSNAGARFAVNNRCDAAAKAEMQKLRTKTKSIYK